MKRKSKKTTHILLTSILTLSALLCGCEKEPEQALEDIVTRAIRKEKKRSSEERAKKMGEFIEASGKATDSLWASFNKAMDEQRARDEKALSD